MIQRSKSWATHAVDFGMGCLIVGGLSVFGVAVLIGSTCKALRHEWRLRRKVAQEKASGHFTGGGKHGRTPDKMHASGSKDHL